ncbi:arginyl-tRNA--protein transferase 1 isoform X1 [Phymastichus coffea]|uniref:arginyl-tRNA--protein transferase 1 isoform X1 n=1 Tax=Phymastichus coffea TaxID=108790 RepID=UPI00273AA9FF|nr:arginyl-tRNA--protein transferase 1 isoform X1 [Phymastichus coffea]
MSKNLYSIIEYHSKLEKNRCGYCHSTNTGYSHGMTAYALSVQHYQNLIDRGWRRSGTYCYKPMMKVTCCPHYTIRCEALNIKISKSQKKILKRVIKFLKNELSKDEEKASPIECDDDIDRNMEVPKFSKYAERAEKNAPKMQVTSVSEELSSRLGTNLNNTKSTSSDSASTSTKKQLVESADNSPIQSMEISNNESSCSTFDPNRAPQKKAKLLRLERKQKKLLAQGKTQGEVDSLLSKTKPQNTEKTLEDYFKEISECSNKLELRLVRVSPPSDSYKSSEKESFELYKKYQLTIHHDRLERLTQEGYSRFMGKSPLRIKLIRVLSDEFLNTLDESAELFKKYQMTIHKEKPEECDKRAFFDFLIKNPLQEWKPDGDLPQGYGSFHEQYWLNGTLIAVAVLDILPSCVSSVYFFYDPAYAHLSLGTFSSLREVFLTRQLNKYAPNLKYYYMGYYIHSCPKMRYKGKMRPSKLLCPETYVWYDIDKCLPKLDVSKYSRLNEDQSATDEDGVVDIQQVPILYEKKTYTYGVFRINFNKNIKDNLIEYSSLVGKTCALQMLYYVD